MTPEKDPSTQPKPGRIPDFANRAEMAAWFDTHDTADYEDEFTPVKVRFAKNLSQPLTVRLDPETLTELRTRAKAKGIGPTTLARMWLLEHLELERARAKPP